MYTNACYKDTLIYDLIIVNALTILTSLLLVLLLLQYVEHIKRSILLICLTALQFASNSFAYTETVGKYPSVG